MVTTEQLFIKFLKQTNAYEQYMYNFKRHRTIHKELINKNKFAPKDFFVNTFYLDFLDTDAFFWRDTKQKYDYWNEINFKWFYNIKKIKEEGLI